MIQGKLWGNTIRLFKHNSVECHKIFVKNRRSCSIHSHTMRSNAFHVISGKLLIQWWKNDYDLVDSIILSDGMNTVVPAGEKHRFVGINDTVALEWYWIDDMRKDIDRHSCGYILDEDELNNILSNF